MGRRKGRRGDGSVDRWKERERMSYMDIACLGRGGWMIFDRVGNSNSFSIFENCAISILVRCEWNVGT